MAYIGADDLLVRRPLVLGAPLLFRLDPRTNTQERVTGRRATMMQMLKMDLSSTTCRAFLNAAAYQSALQRFADDSAS
jgi:hypothetical protein